ncbi:MAG: hypothetical protein K6U74_20475 [Firmicutes bacterium]|nr:hypothetical protein [Bacillota bacterium]
MMVVIISRLRDKVMLFFRLFLAVAILVILVGQLYGIIKSSFQGDLFRKGEPAGKVMQVLEEKPQTAVPGNLLERLKEYYRTK